MILTIRNRALIALAWGPRRVTGRSRYGKVSGAYPAKVTADHRLWLRWVRDGVRRWLRQDVQIVIPKPGANHRVQEAIKHIVAPPIPMLLPRSEGDIATLRQERETLRRQGRFAEADAIRDKIIAAGGAVADGRIPVQR